MGCVAPSMTKNLRWQVMDHPQSSHHPETHSSDGADGSIDEMTTSEADDGTEEAESLVHAAEERAASAARLAEALEILAAAEPVAYHKSLTALLRTGHDGLLKPMPYDASKDYHDPSCVVVDPVPEGLDTMRLYSRFAYRDFDRVLADPINDPRYDHLLTSLYHLTVNEGCNVAVVTNHGELHDIALVLSALVLALCDEDRTFGVLGEHVGLDEFTDRSNLLLSRMVATTEVFNIATTEVLRLMCRTFYSVPQTASRRRSKLDPDRARANNLVMRHLLEQRLEGGGQILAMAASGSQDISVASGLARKIRAAFRARRGDVREDTPSLHLQPLYNGTMNLMMTCDYVVPIAISLDQDHPACEIGSLTKVRTQDDCHEVMNWIASAHESATGIPTIYHQREDDLLTQVRDALRS